VKNPNRCKKVHGCKVAKGTKRTFCRKSHNQTKKRKMTRSSRSPSSAQKRSMRRRRVDRELKRLR